MKKKSVIQTGSILLTVLVLLSSCLSSTLIQSTPPGAKVYINGEPVGKTPYTYSDTKIVGSVTNIDLVKDGYQTVYTAIERTEQVNAGAVVGGLFCAIPFLWVMDYKPVHHYELAPLDPQEEHVNIDSNTDSIESKANNSGTSANKPTKLERLKELQELLDAGVITSEDFEKQKQRILSEI